MDRTGIYFLVILIIALLILGVHMNTSWLHASGIHLYDEDGRRTSLNGVNIVSGQNEGITLADIQATKALGFNTIRLNDLRWGLIQPFDETTQGIDESFFTTGKNSRYRVGLDQIVSWAVDQNMYVILCLSFGQVYNLPPKWAFPSFPSGSTDSEKAQKYMAVFNGTATREATGIANTWKYIANRYKEIPNVMFELLNEPLVMNKELAGNNYKEFNENVISAIESVETKGHLKLIQVLIVVPGWTPITDEAVDVDKSNVVWASHHYDPVGGPDRGGWDPGGSYWHGSFMLHGQYFSDGWGNGTAYAAWNVANVAQRVHAWNRPWTVSEFGKRVTQAHWQEWYVVLINTMRENQVAAWIFFCYDHDPTKGQGWNLRDQATQEQIMPILRQYLLSPGEAQVVSERS